MRETPSSVSRSFDGTPSMTITLTGSATPLQTRPISASSRSPEMKKPDAPAAAYASVEGFTKRLCRVAALGKKQIGPRIDEERHSLLLGGLANDGDAACLPLDVVESRTFNDPVFKVDADHAQVEKTRDIVGQFALVFAIPAFEVHSHRDVDGRDNSPDDLLGQPDRDGLAISVALRLGDRPTARRDHLSARFDNGFGAARVPRVVEQQGGSLHVKRGETRSIFCLVHFILRYRTVAVEPEKT